MISSSGFHLTLPVWLFLSFTFSLTVSPSVPAAKLTFIQLVACFSSTVWWLLRHVWMSKCHTCPRKLITLQSEYIHIILCEPASFPGMEVLKGKTGQLLLTGWMRPSFDVALLCQTCQETEMDSYRGRSCIRQGWRGGADSRLTAVINHLPHQPDAGWQEGARWLEWRFVHSLPEMSFCQPVSGGMLSVINPADHLSINSFSRVKLVCDMLHFTVMLRRCGTASFIFSEPTGCILYICLRKKNCKNVQHT